VLFLSIHTTSSSGCPLVYSFATRYRFKLSRISLTVGTNIDSLPDASTAARFRGAKRPRRPCAAALASEKVQLP
jgi:hypothetical protein